MRSKAWVKNMQIKSLKSVSHESLTARKTNFLSQNNKASDVKNGKKKNPMQWLKVKVLELQQMCIWIENSSIRLVMLVCSLSAREWQKKKLLNSLVMRSSSRLMHVRYVRDASIMSSS